MPKYLGVLLALVRHWLSDDVINAIKRKAVEAIDHGEWSDGERTAFVIDSVRAVVLATPTAVDDFLVEIAARLYLKKYSVAPK